MITPRRFYSLFLLGFQIPNLLVFQSGAGPAEDCPFGKTCLEGPCRNDSSDYIIYCDCPPDTNTYEVGAPDISYCRGRHSFILFVFLHILTHLVFASFTDRFSLPNGLLTNCLFLEICKHRENSLL